MDYIDENNEDIEEIDDELNAEFEKQLAQMEAKYSIECEKWIDRVNRLGDKYGDQVYDKQPDKCLELVYERLRRLYTWASEDVWQDAIINIWKDIKKYKPLMPLGFYLSRQIKWRVKQNWRRTKEKNSRFDIVPTPECLMDDDSSAYDKRDAECAENLAEPDLEERLEMSTQGFTALLINFKTVWEGQKGAKKIRLFKIQYTEQTVYWGCHGMMFPYDMEQDILKAFDVPYFKFITVPTNEETVTLRSIEYAKMKTEGEIFPGKPMNKMLRWTKDRFLPAAVQKEYFLRLENKKVSDAEISNCRKAYLGIFPCNKS